MKQEERVPMKEEESVATKKREGTAGEEERGNERMKGARTEDGGTGKMPEGKGMKGRRKKRRVMKMS